MIVNNFIHEIETLCNTRNVEYIDAITVFAAKNNIEMETIAVWIKKEPALFAKLQAEAENLNAIKSKKGATLF